MLAIVLLAVFAMLAASFASETGMSLRKAGNHAKIDSARLQAESGMAYFSYVLLNSNLPAGVSGQAVLDSLASFLQTRLNGTSNLGGQVVAYDGTEVTVPQVNTNGLGGFQAALRRNEDDTIEVTVTGQEFGCSRRIRMDFQLVPSQIAVFDYGVASKGKIAMTGNAKVLGANDPSEANVLTATYSDAEAARIIGNCDIDGDLCVSNADAHVTLTGNISIGGESIWGGQIDDHIHIGVRGVEFPEADPTVFEPFATNIVDGSTNTNGNKTFTNIRILAGTNPTFSGNITLKGVIFIETPNTVRFTGNLDLTGVVVTEDAGEEAVEENYIHFTGNTSTLGVEALPDEPEFAGLKELPGTFLLAPGFSVRFTGNFGTINGAMAAEEFKWAGNAGGTVHGPIIGWGDYEFRLTGNSHLTIDRSDSPALPPGFSSASRLAAVPTSYEEL